MAESYKWFMFTTRKVDADLQQVEFTHQIIGCGFD